MNETWLVARYIVENRRVLLEDWPEEHVRPARYAGRGVVTRDPSRMTDGVTLLTGVWPDADSGWHLGLRLVAPDGTVLHRWRVAPSEVWEMSPHDDLERGFWSTKYRTHIHGAHLLEGGDVVFNLEYLGLLRLNACSEIVWKLPHRTHHSVFVDDEGYLWVAGDKWHEAAVAAYPGLLPPFIEETVLKVSPDGEIRRKVSLLDVIYKSGYEGLLFADTTDRGFGRNRPNFFNMHLNDVEVLSAGMAPDFPTFEAGDIMVSLRNLNTVMVIDGESQRVKWTMTHPFMRQHDPDFVPGGAIVVFDNRMDDTESGTVFGGSRILRIDPATRAVEVVYPSDQENRFFSNTLGKQQVLENGNILITESTAGRVFEITPAGEVVWSYINRWNETTVGILEQATRYPAELARFEANGCV